MEKVKADQQTRSNVQYPASTAEKTQEEVRAPTLKANKKHPDEP